MSNDLGMDRSGNGNNWTVNNITYADQMVDSPTNNFCTLNPLDADALTTEGNLATVANSAWKNIRGTMFVSSGKWYWETVKTSTASVYAQNGAATSEPSLGEDYGDAQNGLFVYSAHNGTKVGQGSAPASYGDSYATGDVIGVALDMDNGTIKFYKNNTIQNSGTAAFTGITGDVAPWMSSYNNTMNANFGQDSSFAGAKTAQGNQDGNDIGDFYYTPPTGFLALCTKNLPDVAVVPSEHFNPVLYSGNGSTQSITGLGFAPNFSWFKSRSHATSHNVYDSVRGGYKYLLPDLAAAEQTGANGFVSLDSDGFSLNNAGGGGEVNVSGRTYVAWNWKANGSGSSNTNGSINTTKTSANVDAGFSIITYSGNNTAGATIGHGLSKAPEMVIIKSRTNGNDWWDTYHKDIGAANALHLNDAMASADRSYFHDTDPSSTLIYLGSDRSSNGPSETFIAYAFHSVDGYSKVGSYTGNGNNDGTFIYLGFRPAYVMIKNTDDTDNWYVADNKRDTNGNPMTEILNPNLSGAEYTTGSNKIDFTSNGIKCRDSASGDTNISGETYIYIAFAESPFKYSNAR